MHRRDIKYKHKFTEEKDNDAQRWEKLACTWNNMHYYENNGGKSVILKAEQMA